MFSDSLKKDEMCNPINCEKIIPVGNTICLSQFPKVLASQNFLKVISGEFSNNSQKIPYQTRNIHKLGPWKIAPHLLFLLKAMKN